jgi:UDP-N-acetylglucosamine 2-epimerase (non-hydrolysing)
MKIAPLYHALKKESWAKPIIVHTGQHYDANMSDAFFEDFGLPKPDVYLGVGSGTHGEQTAKVMMSYEKVLLEQRPDLVVVVGDVNSTMAVTLVATKIVYPASARPFAVSTPYTQHPTPGLFTSSPVTNHQPSVRCPLVAHLEAGLRSFDRTMPEEINRLVTDVLADMLWTPSPDADENLLREGISPEKICRVGNIMIDSLEMLRTRIESQCTYRAYNLEPSSYAVATFHRPSNVDDPSLLKELCSTLTDISQKIPLVFPVHPRTRKNMVDNQLLSSLNSNRNLHLPEPLPYAEFMNLVFNCRLVITDSGGIQEETSYLGIPCLTVRENTERPITITHGTNQLCSLAQIKEKVDAILQCPQRRNTSIDLWDGKTAERIVKIIREGRRNS